MLISWPDIGIGKDWAYDSQRNMVYTVGNAKIRRYDLNARMFVDPLPVFAYVNGIAISPDNATLVVGLLGIGNQPAGLMIIDLETNTWSQAPYPLAEHEMGIYSLAFAGDTTVLFTNDGTRGVATPLRSYDLATRTFATLGDVLTRTSLTASADGQTIVFAENHSSVGPWGIYDVATRTLTRRNTPGLGTGWIGFDAGVSSQGDQYALPTYGGTFIYNAGFEHVATIGAQGGSRPSGVVYDPVRSRIYFSWMHAKQIRVYDSLTLQFIGAYATREAFTPRYDTLNSIGHLRIAADGSLLFADTVEGIEVIDLRTAPLAGQAVDLAPLFDRSVEPAATVALIDSGTANNNNFYDNYHKNWWTDKYFAGGRVSNNTAIPRIEGLARSLTYKTEVDALLISARVASADLGSFEYAIPVPAADVYTVELYFAETYWGATGGGPGGSGRRVFNVNAEGGPIEIEALDINAEVGPMTALVKRFEIAVSDGMLNLGFTGLVNRPIVSGVGVYLFNPPAAIDSHIEQVWLMNVDTQQPIMPLTDGMTLNLQKLPTRKLAMKAITVPATVGSVSYAIEIDGIPWHRRVESNPPYVYPMDSNGLLLPWYPTIGLHTIKVNTYDGPWAMGLVGRSAIYNVKIIDQP